MAGTDGKRGSGRAATPQTDVLAKKRAAVAQSMSSRLKDLHDKNYRLALEQQFIVVQPAWPAGAAAAGAVGEEQQGEQPATAAARQEEQAQQEQQQKEQQQQEGAHSHEQQADTPQAAAACGGGSSSGDAGAGSSEAGNGALVPVPPSGAARAAGGGGGPVLQVERDAALMSPYIQKEVVQNGVGLPGNPPVLLPKQVTPDSWAMVLEYCRFHLVSGRSDKERRQFDERFIRVDTNLLCELTSAADALEMRPLVDLASRAIARMIEGKSPDQIREAFRLPDDLTEEEKLEPLRTVADDPRIRMLNRLYAKKRKELQERKAQLLQAQQQAAQWQQAQAAGAAGVAAIAAAAAAQQQQAQEEDTRTLEELLSFIEDDGGAKDAKAGGKPGKSKRKKAKQQKTQQQEQEGEGPAPAPAPPAAAELEASASASAADPPAPARPPFSAASGAACASAAGGQSARSATSTQPTGSPASGRSSLDSSPDRLSMLSVQSSASPSPAPGGGGPAAAAVAVAAGALLPRPPLWLPGLAAPAAAGVVGPPYTTLLELGEEDTLMAEAGDEADWQGLAVPPNPFAARAALLHRPITTLTSLAAFRATPPLGSDGPALGPAAQRATPGTGAAAAAVSEPPGGAAAAAAAAEGEGPAAAAAAAAAGSSRGPEAADAAALAALMESFIEGLGLQRHLRVVQGPQPGQAAGRARDTAGGGGLVRRGALPSGAVVQLSWQPQ